MNRICYILILGALFWSCSYNGFEAENWDGGVNELYVELSKSSITLPSYRAHQDTVMIRSNGERYDIAFNDSLRDWISYTIVDSLIIFTIEENPNREIREASLTVNSYFNNAMRGVNLSIVQPAYYYYLILADENIIADYMQFTDTIVIESNVERVEYKLLTSNSWFVVNKCTTDTLIYSCIQNKGLDARVAQLVISGYVDGIVHVSTVLNVTQLSEDWSGRLELDNKFLTFSPNSEEKTVRVMCGGDWYYELEEGIDWCSVRQSGNVLYVTVDRNIDEDRIAKLYVRYGDIVRELLICQDKPIVEFKGGVDVDARGGEIDVEIGANVMWSAKSGANWISVKDSDNYSRDSLLQLSIMPNVSTLSRSAQLQIFFADDVRNMTIVQAGAPVDYTILDLVNSSVSFDSQLTNEVIESCESLKVVGELSYEEFDVIAKMPNLRSLDLSEVTNSELFPSFSNNKTLETIVLPNSLKRIPDEFLMNSEVDFCYIPEGVEEIGVNAFARTGDVALAHSVERKISIPSSIKKICKRAFYGNNIEFFGGLNDGVEVIDSEAFYNSTFVSPLRIPSTLTKLGDNVFGGSTEKRITNLFPENCVIAPSAFSGVNVEGTVHIYNSNLITRLEQLNVEGDIFLQVSNDINLSSVTFKNLYSTTYDPDEIVLFADAIEACIPVGCTDIYERINGWDRLQLHEVWYSSIHSLGLNNTAAVLQIDPTGSMRRFPIVVLEGDNVNIDAITFQVVDYVARDSSVNWVDCRIVNGELLVNVGPLNRGHRDALILADGMSEIRVMQFADAAIYLHGVWPAVFDSTVLYWDQVLELSDSDVKLIEGILGIDNINDAHVERLVNGSPYRDMYGNTMAYESIFMNKDKYTESWSEMVSQVRCHDSAKKAFIINHRPDRSVGDYIKAEFRYQNPENGKYVNIVLFVERI